MISSRRASTAGTSSDPVTASARPGTRRASASASYGRSSALDGMHAQNEHSPPTSRSSTIATLRPCVREPPRRHLAGRPGSDHHHVEGSHPRSVRRYKGPRLYNGRRTYPWGRHGFDVVGSQGRLRVEVPEAS